MSLAITLSSLYANYVGWFLAVESIFEWNKTNFKKLKSENHGWLSVWRVSVSISANVYQNSKQKINKKTSKQTNKQANKQTNKQNKQNKQTKKQKYKQKYKQNDVAKRGRRFGWRFVYKRQKRLEHHSVKSR
jgi:hypothetical protein